MLQEVRDSGLTLDKEAQDKEKLEEEALCARVQPLVLCALGSRAPTGPQERSSAMRSSAMQSSAIRSRLRVQSHSCTAAVCLSLWPCSPLSPALEARKQAHFTGQHYPNSKTR